MAGLVIVSFDCNQTTSVSGVKACPVGFYIMNEFCFVCINMYQIRSSTNVSEDEHNKCDVNVCILESEVILVVYVYYINIIIVT